MEVNPTRQYSLTELLEWYWIAQKKNEPLIIDPCNPSDPEILQTSAVINNTDDIAILTQWLDGIPD